MKVLVSLLFRKFDQKRPKTPERHNDEPRCKAAQRASRPRASTLDCAVGGGLYKAQIQLCNCKHDFISLFGGCDGKGGGADCNMYRYNKGLFFSS